MKKTDANRLTEKISFDTSIEQKEQIQKYAEEHEMKNAEVIRLAIKKLLLSSINS